MTDHSERDEILKKYPWAIERFAFKDGVEWAVKNDPRVLKLVGAVKEVLEAEVEKNERERRKLGLKKGEHIVSGNWRCNISFQELERALTEWSEP